MSKHYKILFLLGRRFALGKTDLIQKRKGRPNVVCTGLSTIGETLPICFVICFVEMMHQIALSFFVSCPQQMGGHARHDQFLTGQDFNLL